MSGSRSGSDSQATASRRPGHHISGEILDGALDAIGRRHFNGATDSQDCLPALFGKDMEKVCKPALAQWNARAPGVVEEMTAAVHGLEEIEHPRRYREQRVREEAWGTRMRARTCDAERPRSDQGEERVQGNLGIRWHGGDYEP